MNKSLIEIICLCGLFWVFCSKFKGEVFSVINKFVCPLWFRLNVKIRRGVVYALMGLLTAWDFIFFNLDEVIIRGYDGLAFIFFLGSFFCLAWRYGGGALFSLSPDGQKSTITLIFHGFIYWLFYFIGALYWLVYPLTLDLKTHGLLIPFALIAVPAYLAIPLLLPIYFTKKFCKNVWNAALVFATSTFVVMYLQGHYGPGFPWALPGYACRDRFIMQAISVWGIYGQTFFMLLMGSLCGVAFTYADMMRKFSSGEESHEENFNKFKKQCLKKCCIAIAIVIISIISLGVFGAYRIGGNSKYASEDPKDYTRYKIRCIQGSILQKNKMDKNLSANNFNLYLNLSRKESVYDNWNPDFVIWPEASVPYLFTDDSVVLHKKLSEVVPKDGYLLTGVVRRDSSNRNVYNSVAILDQFGTNIVNYDKKHLVPFGEYIPFRSLIPKVFAPIANSIGDFDIGQNSNIIKLKELKMALTICYEAIFPGEFVSEDVDVIVNITNDAWFGHTSELAQHLNIVRARAIEEGVPLIRVTNFGISAVFDAYGREVDFLRTDDVGVIDCYIPKKVEKTFYRKFFVD